MLEVSGDDISGFLILCCVTHRITRDVVRVRTTGSMTVCR